MCEREIYFYFCDKNVANVKIVKINDREIYLKARNFEI